MHTLSGWLDGGSLTLCTWILQEGFSESLVLPIEQMSYNQPEQTYILLDREPNSLEFGTFVPTLRFTVKEIDPSTGWA